MIPPRLCPHGVLGIKKCRLCRNAAVAKSRAKARGESEEGDLAPVAEIAQELGMTHDAVRSTIRRALTKLRDGRAECLKGFEFPNQKGLLERF